MLWFLHNRFPSSSAGNSVFLVASHRLVSSPFIVPFSQKKQRAMSLSSSTLRFDDGAVQFRQRLVVSVLSRRSVLIRNIRSENVVSAPGLEDHEVCFLRLLDAITNGTVIEINSTGTQVRFKPGILVGGSHSITCPNSRGIGWFVEGILPLAPFGKESLRLELEGVTDGTSHMDPSLEYLSRAASSLMQQFGIGSDQEQLSLSITVKKHGAFPLGGGAVEFQCPLVKELQPLDLTDDLTENKIKRIRGLVTSCNIPVSSASRASHAAKGVLLRVLPDVWIHTKTISKKDCGGPSPSLGILLGAETVNGAVVHCAETCFTEKRELPEDLGVRAACLLLDEVQRGGCVDTGMQSLALLLMCLCPEDVCRIRVATLSTYTIESLRLFKKAFGIEFKITPSPQTQTVFLSCLGSGFTNMAKKST